MSAPRHAGKGDEPVFWRVRGVPYFVYRARLWFEAKEIARAVHGSAMNFSQAAWESFDQDLRDDLPPYIDPSDVLVYEMGPDGVRLVETSGRP